MKKRDEPEKSDQERVKKTVALLDRFSPLYSELSGGRAFNYEDYTALQLADEETLIRPTLFPAFLDQVLDFSKLDYTPERRRPTQKIPDFTPNDILLHPFIFETKGNDSARSDLVTEYRKKSVEYVRSIPQAKYAIITNMRELVVFSKEEDKPLEEYSFSFLALYRLHKDKPLLTEKESDFASFIRFVRKFSRRPLSTPQKIKAIAEARHEPKQERIPARFDYESLTHESLTDSIRKIVEWLREDARIMKGQRELLDVLKDSPDRRRLIAMEIFAIRGEISNGHEMPEETSAEDLDKILISNEEFLKRSVALYFYRVAYFTMVRILLVRAWEDSGFIAEKYQTLFDGGFAKWYFETYNQQILDVLKQAFQFAKEKYEWLYTDQTNYSWFLPDDDTLADVLYELAKYDLSVLNRDVLGAVYEDYLDTQDKKNIGQYYTPFPIVNLIWNRIGYRSNKDFYRIEIEKRIPRKVFDPATGSGGFLVEAARRIRTDGQARKTVRDVLDVKNAIVNGLYGSEISVFSYYITEVSLLIQLTPVIQRIISLEPKRREAEGKFTLSVVRQDSLNLHNPPERIDEGEKPEADEHSRYGLELLKPTGEKLRVYESIKENSEFDYVAANPPYIGEDGHKELFRRTLALFPYWKEYFQGKMDYLYFFLILGIQKLRPHGRLGFITTSYWLTADGASKLRKYVLSTTRIVEIISFQEIKLFEHAKGQHNIVFILEREDDPLKRGDSRVKLVEVRKQFERPTVSKKIQALCDHIEKHVDRTQFADDYIDVYSSAIKQSELTENPWYLFHKEDDESLLKRIESTGVRLDSLADVHQGVVPGCLSVDQTVLDALPQPTIEKYGIVPGMGVLVLTKEELDSLSIPKRELSIIRPYYKNSNVHRYLVDRNGENYLIYTNKQTRISDYPTVLRHLEIFKPRLEMKRETMEGKLPWWSLHWPREQYIFEGKKIVCPYRAKLNTFAYDDGSFYGSTDMYFITEKRDKISLLDSSHVDLLYILGTLNSNVMRLWTQYKTKPKGGIRELFHTALQGFPIRPIKFEDKGDSERHDKIVKYVKEIIDLKARLSKYDPLFKPRLFELSEYDELPEFDTEDVVQLLSSEDIRTLRTSEAVSIGKVPSNFQLRKVLGIESSALRDSAFKHQLILESKQRQIVTIEGEKDLLELLKQLLDHMRGRAWKEIENLRIPVSTETMKRAIENSKAEILESWGKIRKLQSLIDDEVCRLYNLDREIIDLAVSNFG